MEEVGDTGLNMDNRVGDWSTEDDLICKACCMTDMRVVGIGLSELSKGTSSILNLEWK